MNAAHKSPGLDEFAAQRQAMVDQQLRRRGIRDPRVLAAMLQVPRHRFVAPEFQSRAYEDHPLPIGQGQTVSQPYIVALSLAALNLQGREKVLEVGTGSGYQTALLAHLGSEVYSIERHPSLAHRATTILEELGLKNVKVAVGDGSYGLQEYSPYGAILVSAAAPSLPQSLLQQLSDGGRMVIPVGAAEAQQLQLISKDSGKTEMEILEGCRFVPLIGREGY